MQPQSGPRLVADRVALLSDEADIQASSDEIDLSDDTPRYAEPPGIREAVEASLDAGETHYTDRLGITPLRERLVAVLADRDSRPYQVSNMLITSGRQESLFAAIQALTGEGGRVVTVEPDLPDYARLAMLRGKETVSLPSEQSDWQSRLSGLAGALAPGDVLILSSPSRVTGQMPDDASAAQLAAVVENGATLILDTTLLGLGRDGPLSLRSLNRVPGLMERTVTLGTFAVEYGLSGWGVGYVAAPEPLLKQIAAMVQSMNICIAAPSQHAALAALDASDEWFAARHQERLAIFEAATDGLRQLGLQVASSDTISTLWVDIRPLGQPGQAVAAALGGQGVRVAPGSRFGAGGEGYIRLTLPGDIGQLRAALDRVGAAISAL